MAAKKKKRKATPAQLKALAKGRRALKAKRKTAAKKNPSRKKPAKRKVAKKTTRKKSARKNPVRNIFTYLIYIKKNSKAKTRYYLKKDCGKWVWQTGKPAKGMTKTQALNLAKTEGAKMMRKCPARYVLEMDLLKKKA